jgi:hypothetical protein
MKYFSPRLLELASGSVQSAEDFGVALANLKKQNNFLPES